MAKVSLFWRWHNRWCKDDWLLTLILSLIFGARCLRRSEHINSVDRPVTIRLDTIPTLGAPRLQELGSSINTSCGNWCWVQVIVKIAISNLLVESANLSVIRRFSKAHVYGSICADKDLGAEIVRLTLACRWYVFLLSVILLNLYLNLIFLRNWHWWYYKFNRFFVSILSTLTFLGRGRVLKWLGWATSSMLAESC